MRNTITLYVNDEGKAVYKAFKQKVKGEGKSVSEAVIAFMQGAIA